VSPPTSEEISERLESARRAAASAADELKAAREAHKAAVVAGANELTVGSARRKIDDARARAEQAQERVKLLGDALAEALEREAAQAIDEQLRVAGETLAERARKLAEIDDLLVKVGAAVAQLFELSPKAIAQLPKRPGWTPAMFGAGSLSQRIYFRLIATTGGLLPAPKHGMSLWDAQRLPDLGTLGERERAEILGQFGVQTETETPQPQKRGKAAGEKS
jgi:hypothetical protein